MRDANAAAPVEDVLSFLVGCFATLVGDGCIGDVENGGVGLNEEGVNEIKLRGGVGSGGGLLVVVRC